jgi:hypothetical protein
MCYHGGRNGGAWLKWISIFLQVKSPKFKPQSQQKIKRKKKERSPHRMLGDEKAQGRETNFSIEILNTEELLNRNEGPSCFAKDSKDGWKKFCSRSIILPTNSCQAPNIYKFTAEYEYGLPGKQLRNIPA